MKNLLRVLLLGLLVGLPAPGWGGSMTLLGVGSPGAAGCVQTGVFDLTNTCNDIYLLTGAI
jgi:hypothetical protein